MQITELSHLLFPLKKASKAFLLCSLGFILLFSSCLEKEEVGTKVEIRRTIGKYSFYVNGNPFSIKGAGMGSDCPEAYQKLIAAGGNAIRTWSLSKAEAALDSAEKYGLKVALGLDMGKELYGFDYSDSMAVKTQYNRITSAIEKYKAHPSLLCWVAGNELNLVFKDDGSLAPVNPLTYKALNDIIAYIKRNDPNHPVTTTFAGVHKEQIESVLEICPELDFISLQVFGELKDLPQLVAELDTDIPYLITEFGPTGHWEMPSTTWGREIEELSGNKALGLQDRIEAGFSNDNSGRNLGGFVFLWGQKQERTPTWYGVFLNSCEASETYDVMTKWWTGSYPENRSPHLNRLTIDGETALQNIRLEIDKTYTAEVFATDPEEDMLTYKWHILAEVEERSQGGAFEEKPGAMRFRILGKERNTLIFQPPPVAGEYRLFVYAYDGNGNAAYGNIPFLIQ